MRAGACEAGRVGGVLTRRSREAACGHGDLGAGKLKEAVARRRVISRNPPSLTSFRLKHTYRSGDQSFPVVMSL